MPCRYFDARFKNAVSFVTDFSVLPWAEVATTIIQSMSGHLRVVGCGRGPPGHGSETLVIFYFPFQFWLSFQRQPVSPHSLVGAAVAILGVCLISTFNVSRSLEVRLFLITEFMVSLFCLSIDPILLCAGYRPCCGPSKRCGAGSFNVAFVIAVLLSPCVSSFDVQSYFA